MRGIVKGGLNDGGSNIKSIQRGTAAMNNVSTLDVAISSVDLSKSILLFGTTEIFDASTAYLAKFSVMGKLTTSTNINFSSINTTYSSNPIIIYWQVTEFNNVKSLQRGDVSVTSSNIDIPVTISSVDMSKSYAIASVKNDSTSYTTPTGMICAVNLSSSTNLNVRCARYTVNPTVHYQVIEFM